MNEDYDFMKWFVKYYKPDPNEKGWYIDKLIPGVRVKMQFAKKTYKIVKALKNNP